MIWRRIRTLLPKSLFGRALLIVVLPTLLVQLVTTYIFYERHWDNVSKHMALALANEITYVTRLAQNPGNRRGAMKQAERYFGIEAHWRPRKAALPQPQQDSDRLLTELKRHLRVQLKDPFSLSLLPIPGDERIRTTVHLRDGDLQLFASRKRVASSTTTIFLLWATGSAVLFLLIAVLFLYNQVKPIEQLADVAENFGKGQEIDDFKPRGATEVRRAGQAFLVMSERIRRQIGQRTEMLAAVSHDLRTPLTRMKLQLAMLPPAKDVELLQADIQEMEAMLQAYLEFARGEGTEGESEIHLRDFMEQLAENGRRQGLQVTLDCRTAATVSVREQALRRALSNLLNNASRHATALHLRVWRRQHMLAIVFDDNGPGIPPEEREQVFRPFYRGDAARKRGKGEGVGLGLSIAKDIILSHGGQIELGDAPEGGLRVSIRLPV